MGEAGGGVEDPDDPAPAGERVLGVGEDLGAELDRADEKSAMVLWPNEP